MPDSGIESLYYDYHGKRYRMHTSYCGKASESGPGDYGSAADFDNRRCMQSDYLFSDRMQSAEYINEQKTDSLSGRTAAPMMTVREPVLAGKFRNE